MSNIFHEFKVNKNWRRREIQNVIDDRHSTLSSLRHSFMIMTHFLVFSVCDLLDFLIGRVITTSLVLRIKYFDLAQKK